MPWSRHEDEMRGVTETRSSVGGGSGGGWGWWRRRWIGMVAAVVDGDGGDEGE